MQEPCGWTQSDGDRSIAIPLKLPPLRWLLLLIFLEPLMLLMELSHLLANLPGAFLGQALAESALNQRIFNHVLHLALGKVPAFEPFDILLLQARLHESLPDLLLGSFPPSALHTCEPANSFLHLINLLGEALGTLTRELTAVTPIDQSLLHFLLESLAREVLLFKPADIPLL
jgi:hypothetical protein